MCVVLYIYTHIPIHTLYIYTYINLLLINKVDKSRTAEKAGREIRLLHYTSNAKSPIPYNTIQTQYTTIQCHIDNNTHAHDSRQNYFTIF